MPNMEGFGSRSLSKYFVMRLGGHGSQTGIWKCDGKELMKMFNVVVAPKYRPRFHFDCQSKQIVKHKYQSNLEKALRYYIRNFK